MALSADASCLRRRFVAPKIGSCKSLCRRAAGTLLERRKTLTICGSPVQSLVMCIGRMQGQITEATGNDCPCPAQAGRMTCLVPFRRTAGVLRQSTVLVQAAAAAQQSLFGSLQTYLRIRIMHSL